MDANELILDAYYKLPEEIRSQILYPRTDLRFFEGARILPDMYANGPIVQFVTHLAKGIKHSVMYIYAGSSLKEHTHAASEAVQEITPNGFVVGGKPAQWEIYGKNVPHGTDPIATDSIIAIQKHDEGITARYKPLKFGSLTK